MKDQRVTSGFQTAEAFNAKKNPVDAATSSGVRVSIAISNENENTLKPTVLQAQWVPPIIRDLADRAIPFTLTPHFYRRSATPQTAYRVGVFVGRKLVCVLGGLSDYPRAWDLCRLISDAVPGAKVRM